MATLMDGKYVSQKIRTSLKEKASLYRGKYNRAPGIAVILVGDDPASNVYVNMKEKACNEAGFLSIVRRLPATSTTEEVLSLVHMFNSDESVNGILVQLPLPKHIDEKRYCLLLTLQRM